MINLKKWEKMTGGPCHGIKYKTTKQDNQTRQQQEEAMGDVAQKETAT